MSAGRKLGYIPSLPNVGSKHQTANTLKIDLHYAQLLLIERWTWDRYLRLCKFLEVSPAELASTVMLSHKQLENYEKNNRIRLNGRPITLLLTLLEAHCCSNWTHDIIEDPFPDLNSI